MLDTVSIFEVGPRDGLQNETRFVPTDRKIDLINRLSACGFTKIEATSFVSPDWVPQMADAGLVLDTITRTSGVRYCALTPNLRGLQDAINHGADEVAIFAAASEEFSHRNINCSIDESLERYLAVLREAKGHKVPVRGYVSTIANCPYSGPVDPVSTARVVHALLDMGCYEVSLGETTGIAPPEAIERLLTHLRPSVPAERLAGHFHDTDGYALANIDLCLAHGIRSFDSSVAGLGGCPFSPGAKGNVASEAVCKHLHQLGFDTGIELEKLLRVAEFAKGLTRNPIQDEHLSGLD
ncbi:MAG: hydroxymethylglutaryl-CoA lyase [Rhizobiaceae bacterium]